MNRYTKIEPWPRIIRLSKAPKYLGMNINRFNKEVRPYVTNIPIGTRGIGFDRYELDAWIDKHINSHGYLPNTTNVGVLSHNKLNIAKHPTDKRFSITLERTQADKSNYKRKQR